MIRIVPVEAPREVNLSPDIVWNPAMQVGDLALAGDDEPGNRLGLRATDALTTAVTICLMTDARADEDELRDGDQQRGWLGDTFDLDASAGEVPIGSRLWLLRRRTVDDVHVPRLAETWAAEALQCLIDQGAVARVDVTATADPARSRLDLAVVLTNRDGATIVAPRFQILWEGRA